MRTMTRIRRLIFLLVAIASLVAGIVSLKLTGLSWLTALCLVLWVAFWSLAALPWGDEP